MATNTSNSDIPAIAVERARELKPLPQPGEPLPFGRVPTDHMFICDYRPAKGGWHEPRIVPYGPFTISPSALVLHYGQEIFEGIKAYRGLQEEIFLFRPDENARRFQASAQRLGMQPVPESLFIQGVSELVKIEKRWIPPYPGSLYIRPTLIALDEGISYRSSESYRFFVIVCPVANYYSTPGGISVAVERGMTRASPGGVGEAKCGGNYAAAIQPLARAKARGAEQILWLDANEHRYVEEAGTMNIMFVYGDRLVTPALSGSILRGVTRDSLIRAAQHWGLEVSEERLAIDQVIRDIKEGRLTEAFGCGTAAVATSITALIDGDEKVMIGDGQVGKVTERLKQGLLAIQTGRAEDPFGWRWPLSLER